MLVFGAFTGIFALACSVEPKGEAVSTVQQADTTVCQFKQPSKPGPPLNRTFSVKVPHGISVDQLTLATSGGQLMLKEGVQVLGSLTGYSGVSNVDTSQILDVGERSEVGNAFSELAGVKLRERAHVRGFVKTSSSVAKGANVVVDGGISEHVSLRPLEVISWDVAFPSGDRGSCSLDQARSLVLAPGAYGALSVGAQAHLKLSAG
ncbi:MAG TPA: hypothetical protein VNG33_17480, partial [Polyangiaceae bacterium]|nr:hypothetical protein [Polyangiaceae bacterium]